jgi:hypothetical protein
MKYFEFELVTAVTAKQTAVKGLTMLCRILRGVYT